MNLLNIQQGLYSLMFLCRMPKFELIYFPIQKSSTLRINVFEVMRYKPAEITQRLPRKTKHPEADFWCVLLDLRA
jgi:hypothetical protein